MILNPADAQRFIRWYSLLLLEVLGEASPDVEGGLVATLVQGRAKLMKEPTLFEGVKTKLAARFADVDSEIVAAVASLDVRKWVYLRDTTRHSIFVDPSSDRAFGVVGLTEPLRDVLGGSGVYLETGLVRYRGYYVCDGLIAQNVWLGPNYKKSFNERYREIKAAGRFSAYYTD